MKRPSKRLTVISIITLASLSVVFFGAYRLGRATQSVQVQIHPDRVMDARLIEREGVVLYEVRSTHGPWSTMTPEDFAEAVWEEHQSRTLGQRLLLRVLNISTTATAGWVILGLVGQVCFAGRMIVQWVVSEKARASVIPNAFWWMALAGATMLLVYFVWRKDIVGILGQSTGWLIYTRNLYFIYFNHRHHQTGNAAPANASAEETAALSDPPSDRINPQ